MDKKVIVAVNFVCHCYNASVGVKGNSGDPGDKGPRGLTGKIYSIDVFTFKDTICHPGPAGETGQRGEGGQKGIHITRVMSLLCQFRCKRRHWRFWC